VATTDRWKRFLDLITPASARVITDAGEFYNWADYMALQERYSLLRQTVENGAVEFGRRCTVPSAQSTTGYYYAFDIPQGREVSVWQRDLVLSEGLYEIDLVSAPDGWAGGNTAFKRQLRAGSTQTVQSDIICGVTPNNAGNLTTIMQLPWVDTGEGQGNRRAGGAAAIPGALTLLSEDAVLIRVRRTTAAEFRTSILALAWEEDV
jgi:hypothetical protein